MSTVERWVEHLLGIDAEEPFIASLKSSNMCVGGRRG